VSAQSTTLVDQVVDRTITLASIPAPTGEEAARAELITLWWRSPYRHRFWTAGLLAFAGYGVVRVFYPTV